MNDLEWCAVVFCLTAIAIMLLFNWLYGRDDPYCQDCEQGRRCHCQKESKR